MRSTITYSQKLRALTSIAGANTTPGLSEEFGNRRKRRRTSSPNAGPLASQNGFICATENAPKEWENQLRAAANGEGSTPMGCSEPPHTSQTEPRKNDIMKRRVIQPTSLSNIARHTSSVLQVEITKTKLEECGNKFGALPKQRTTTPPKTMLAIRSDGKLVSPKLQIAAPYPNSKRRKQEPELGGKTKEKIVKIKYGSSDESRKYLAQKIHDICSGMTVRPDELIKNPKVFEPAIVAKPTHPFFLGTNSRNKEPKVACESSAVGDSIRLDGECKQNINISLEKADAQITLSTNTNADATLPTLKEISYSLGIPRPVRFHGAKEPIWPPKDMGHVRPQMHMIAAPAASTTASHISYRRRKLKYAKIHIAEQEEILCLYSNLVNSQVMCKGDDNPQTMNKFGQPNRKIMTGPELQNAIHSLLTFKVPGIATLQPKEFQKDALGGLRTVPGDTHSALLRVFKEISTSRTAFDRFECETHDWTYKYAPKRAEEVLQLGREALILRDWLKSLTVTSIGSGSSALPKGQDKSIPSRMFDANSKRKKRKRAEKLDGFVISSDEETVEMEGLVNPEAGESDAHDIALGKKSIIRATNISGHPTERQRAANAIVISGPHGCGKTAAVFAVARELDFEVFEINSGSRRSGKDVLEKVGDVTKNHLVNQAGDTKKDGVAKSVADIAEFPITATSSSYQGTVRALLQPKAEMKKKPRGRPKKLAKDPNTDDNSNKKQSQKQSLILLEEVDVLFEEDRQFWATTLDLILHSKRPIIMTCTDESLLPLDEMFLFAVLRFTPPPEPLAIDYLLLVASNEGHLLSRKALSHLLRSKHSDLRASLTELNFFCQMAIGDTKGGLEWMLIQSSSTNNQIQEDKNLRVVSLGTYSEDLDYSNRLQQNLKTKAHTHGAEKFASGIWECWNGDANYSSGHHITSSLVNERRRKQELALERLVAFEHVIDAISAADTHLFSEHRQNELVCGRSP